MQGQGQGQCVQSAQFGAHMHDDSLRMHTLYDAGEGGELEEEEGVKCIGQYLHQSGFCLEFCHLIQCIDARNQTQTELLICFQKWILISLEKLTEL